MNLVGRARELAVLERAITSAGRRRAALGLVEGPTGIGKSSLIRQAVSLAGPRFTVATATCVPLERDFAFGAVRQLFESLLFRLSPVTRKRLLTGSAASASRVLDGITESHSAAEAPELMHAALHGLHRLTVNLTDDGPLLLVVDDLQWADAASLRWLAYLTHRWADLPVALFAGLRTGEEPVDPEALETLLARAIRLPLAGLDRAESAELLGEVEVEVRPDLIDPSHEVTGGNPYLLGELVSGMRAGRLQTIEDLEAYGPSRIAETVLHRLRRTSPDAVALASAVAVLDDRADLGAAACVAEVEFEAATGAVEVLEAQHILRSEGTRLSFVHSIVRNSVVEDIPPARRLLLHARAARELHRQRQPAEQIAAHIIAAELTQEPWLAEVLGSAADTAAHRGSPDAAVRYLAHAVRLPLDCDDHARFLGRLGGLELYTAPDEGRRHLRQALELAEGVQLRAELAAAMGRRTIEVHTYNEARELLDPELAKLRAVDGDLALVIELQLLGNEMLSHLPSAEVVERLRELRTEIGPGVNWRLDALLAVSTVMAGGSTGSEVRDMLTTLPLDVSYEDQGVIWALLTAVTLPGPALTDAIALARRRGWLDLSANGELQQGSDALDTGDLVAARDHIGRAYAMFQALGYPTRSGLGALLFTLSEMGEVAEAEALLERSGHAGTPVEEHPELGMHLFLGRAGLFEAMGKYTRALSDLRALGERAASIPELDARRLVTMARISHATGAHEHALEYAGRAHALAREHAGIPRAFVLTVLGEITGDQAMLDEAVSEAKEDRLTLARALVARGSLDPSRRVEDLTQGFDLGIELGAKPLVERARRELAKVGLRPRRPRNGTDALTAQERAVAELAADGMSNRQIADDLFLARRTIEQHLTAAYRKLGISGRRELRTSLRH